MGFEQAYEEQSMFCEAESTQGMRLREEMGGDAVRGALEVQS